MSELLQARVAAALEALRLSTAKANLAQHLRAGQERDLPTISVLDALLADELTARRERSIIVNTKLAHLRVLKTIDSFDFDAQPTLDRRAINDLQLSRSSNARRASRCLGQPASERRISQSDSG